MIGKYDKKIKFDKIGGYQDEGSPQTRMPKFNLNHLSWTDEIFRRVKYEEKIKFDKIPGIPQWVVPLK